MVGNLSKYAKITVTPSDGSYIEFANALDVDPLYIYISAPENSEAMTENNYVRAAIIYFPKFGAVYNTITTGAERVNGTVRHNTPTLSGRFGYYNDKIRIPWSPDWNTNTEYSVEFYA